MRRRLEAFRGELNLSSHAHCLDEQYRSLERSKTSNFVSQPNRTQHMLLCLRGRSGVGYSGVQRSCEYPHIPALRKNRLKLLEGFALFSLSPGYTEEPSGLGAPPPLPPYPWGPEARLGLDLSVSCVHFRLAFIPGPSAPVGKFIFPGKISWDGNYFPRNQKCEIRLSMGLASSEALRASVPGLSPACGGCQRAWACLRPHVAFSLRVCLSVCAFPSYKDPGH